MEVHYSYWYKCLETFFFFNHLTVFCFHYIFWLFFGSFLFRHFIIFGYFAVYSICCILVAGTILFNFISFNFILSLHCLITRLFHLICAHFLPLALNCEALCNLALKTYINIIIIITFFYIYIIAVTLSKHSDKNFPLKTSVFSVGDDLQQHMKQLNKCVVSGSSMRSACSCSCQRLTLHTDVTGY